jgi:hypothetical protein
MKTYVYNEYIDIDNSNISDVNSIKEITEDQIIEQYWDYWFHKMIIAYHSPNASNAKQTIMKALREHCIDDWVTVNWASEKNECI